jgi:hypothetical protein
MQIQRVDWIDEYKKSIDEIASTGADTVMLAIDSRMENGTSSKIYLDTRMTPTPDQLGALIDHAKSKNLRAALMLKILLDDPRGNEWSGTIHPESWDTWWASYRDVLTHFAWVAEAHHVDVFVVGSELVTAEHNVAQWQTTLRAVRQVYTGRLTYSANWDHYTSVPFWDLLDFVAVNGYYTLGPDRSVTADQIAREWARIQTDLLAFAAQKGRPLLFTEIGWCSQDNAATVPWDYTQNRPTDDELQQKLYDGFFRAWWGNPSLGGFLVWEWSPGDGGRGTHPQRTGYTPENKPAEQTLRRWLANPRWTAR